MAEPKKKFPPDVPGANLPLPAGTPAAVTPEQINTLKTFSQAPQSGPVNTAPGSSPIAVPVSPLVNSLQAGREMQNQTDTALRQEGAVAGGQKFEAQVNAATTPQTPQVAGLGGVAPFTPPAKPPVAGGTTPPGQQPGSGVGAQTLAPIEGRGAVQPVGENIGTSASDVFAQGVDTNKDGKANSFSATGRVYADELTKPTKLPGERTAYEGYQRGLAILRGTDQNLRTIENQEKQFGENLQAETDRTKINAGADVAKAQFQAQTEDAKLGAKQDEQARAAADNVFKNYSSAAEIPEAQVRSTINKELPGVNKLLQDTLGEGAAQFPTDRPLNQQEASMLVAAFDDYDKKRRNYYSSTWQSTFYPPPTYAQSLLKQLSPSG